MSSWYCKAWLIDGKLAGLGGVEGPFISRMGYVWLVLAEWASTGFPRAVYREAKRQLAIMMDTRHQLITNILLEDKASYNFARHLGFSLVPNDENPFSTVLMEYPHKKEIVM